MTIPCSPSAPGHGRLPRRPLSQMRWQPGTDVVNWKGGYNEEEPWTRGTRSVAWSVSFIMVVSNDRVKAFSALLRQYTHSSYKKYFDH